jgi:transposase
MKKRAYRSTEITKVNIAQLAEKVKGKKVVFGVDIAKQDNYGALLIWEEKEPVITIKWRHPERSREMVQVLKSLGATKVEVALEPSGTYGDPVRNLFWDEGIEVYRVSAKRSHDAVEVYDGVPSWHDAKSGAVIGKLHVDGVSRLWQMEGAYERDLAAVVNTMDMVQQQYQQNANRLEALMARHWPEAGEIVELGSATFLELLGRFGSAQEVVRQAGEARQLIQKVAGRFLEQKKIEQLIGSAQKTIGLPMTAIEAEEIIFLARRTRQLQHERKEAKKRVEGLAGQKTSIVNMSKVTGMATAAVLVKGGGDPTEYTSPTQWVKGLGLNLKEKSSGKHKGKLKITKRGSGQARRWLYFAVLRLIQKDAVVKAWYERKIVRDGGVKMKALTAIMRKLAAGLWHVAQGKEFDTEKLFDVKRLGEIC